MKNLRARSKGEERRTFLKTALAGTIIEAESLRERKTAAAASLEDPLPELPEG
jgi:tRNA isopentenyl-2-thiomethyl-A-37 hydroxylase MiaE